ncbi:MAG TPA: hypothetical protein VGV35_06140, partial [Bryobacteraceae bacterium]|nr:hypothetical protein [Bryobacteraceae bacterium]
MRIKILTIALVLTASVALHAATAFNVTGPSPFTISGEIADVLSFTLANPYTNVTITMPFADITGGGPIGGTEGTVFLTNQIGAGTTVANQIAVPVTISGLSAAFSTRTLFTGLTLPAGTYFVVVARTTTF